MGRLGCSECYNSFRKYLMPLLKRIHGSSRHYGKIPLAIVMPAQGKPELAELKTKLEKAIRDEEFEEAARIRDALKELEKKGPENKE